MKYFVLVLSLIISPAAFGNVFPVLQADSGYKTVEISKDLFYKNLPFEANESSGLIYWDGLLWTHNDSGGKAAIYGFDTITGTIQRTVFIKGAKNIDWEDIAQDAGYIYIGDFGNNVGARRTMFIYKIAKGGITSDKKEVFVPARQIAFKYADQESYKKRRHAHNFDCEAFFAFENHLYLFTKNWADQKTRLYKMPKKVGMYDLSPEATFEAGGLITGADISRSGKRVALIGYIDFVSFMWLFWDFDGDDFFGGKKLRVDLPEMVFVQTEAIAFASGDELFFSCEESAMAPTLFRVGFNELINSSKAENITDREQIILPGKVEQNAGNELIVQFDVTAEADVLVELRNTAWKVLDEKSVSKSSTGSSMVAFDIKGFKPGTYFVNFVLQNNFSDEGVKPSDDKSLVKIVKIK